MQQDQFQRMEELFQAAIELPVELRASFLANAAGEDVALRESVLRLLAYADAGAPLPRLRDDETALDVTATPDRVRPPIESEGSRVGPYKLLQLIGEGGFGVVYMAEQEAPVRRRVALKVIKVGMDTRKLIARFEAERQALSLMEHPNIARVFDAGATDTGRPYFVMELLEGESITDYCDRNNLTIADRLDLFAQVWRRQS
jgi:serine/threonine protein kinase